MKLKQRLRDSHKTVLGIGLGLIFVLPSYGATFSLEPVNTVWSFEQGKQVYILQQSELNAGNRLALDARIPIHRLAFGKLRLIDGAGEQLVDSYQYGQPSPCQMESITLSAANRLDYFEKTTDRYELPGVSPDGQYVTVNKFNRLQKILAVLDRSGGDHLLHPLLERGGSDNVFSNTGNKGEYYERDIAWLTGENQPRVLFVSNGQIMVGDPRGNQFKASPAPFTYAGIPFMPEWRSRREIVWTEKNAVKVGNLESGRVKSFSRADYESLPRIDVNKADPDLIAYVARKDGNSQIGILNLATGVFTALAGGADAEAFNAAWSPNGYEIAYVLLDSRARLRTLKLYDIRTGQSRQLSNENFTLTRESNPTFYPDGSAVFYVGEDEYGLSKLLYSDVSQTNQSRIVSVKFGDRDVQSVQGVAFFPNRLEEMSISSKGLRVYLIAQSIARPELYEIELPRATFNATGISLKLPKAADNNYIASPRAVAGVESARLDFEKRYRQAKSELDIVLGQAKEFTQAPAVTLSYPANLTFGCAQNDVQNVKAAQARFASQLADQLSTEFTNFRSTANQALQDLDRIKRADIRKDPALTPDKVFSEWRAVLKIPENKRSQARQKLEQQARAWRQALQKAQSRDRAFTTFLRQQQGNLKTWAARLNQTAGSAARKFGANYPRTDRMPPAFQPAYQRLQKAVSQALADINAARERGITAINSFASSADCNYQQAFQLLRSGVNRDLDDMGVLSKTLEGYQAVWNGYVKTMDGIITDWNKLKGYLTRGDENVLNQRLPTINTSAEQLRAMTTLKQYYVKDTAQLRKIVRFMDVMEKNRWPDPADAISIRALQEAGSLAAGKGDDWIERARNGVVIEYVKGKYFPHGQSIDPKSKDLKKVRAYIRNMGKKGQTVTRDFGKMVKAWDAFEATKP